MCASFRFCAQLYDNALIAAGVVDDPRHMLDRLNQLLGHALEKAKPEESNKETVVEPEVVEPAPESTP